MQVSAMKDYLPAHLKFGYAHMMEMRAIRAELRAERTDERDSI